jgi:hypothetical protein
MARKKQEIKDTPKIRPSNARCLNCEYSPILYKPANGNPIIAYCTLNKDEPQVARQHCCKCWREATKEKIYK